LLQLIGYFDLTFLFLFPCVLLTTLGTHIYILSLQLSNLAGTVANSIAGALANVWDVSNETLARHQYDGMWKMTLFCGCIQLAGLFFLPLLPSGIEEQVLRRQYEIFSHHH
jgi:hypothetical protein